MSRNIEGPPGRVDPENVNWAATYQKRDTEWGSALSALLSILAVVVLLLAAPVIIWTYRTLL